MKFRSNNSVVKCRQLGPIRRGLGGMEKGAWFGLRTFPLRGKVGEAVIPPE